MWIWLAMLDLKIHVLHDKSFSTSTSPSAGVIMATVTRQ